MNIWMVRAGKQSYLIEDFLRGYVGIGWSKIGDMSKLQTLDEMKQKYIETYPDHKPGGIAGAASMAHKFRSIIQKGDKVVTYDSSNREYHVGMVTSDYIYKPKEITDFPNIREVKWEECVSRDNLSATSRNSLGSTLTLFTINDDVWQDFEALFKGEIKPEEILSEDDGELLDNVREQSKEFIKDRITKLDPYEYQDLVAGLLRAMGYKTRVSPPGADRGVDILASPDGLGFEQPRIVVECKHRKGSMGAPEVRSFLGGRHQDDKGLYVSSGGFTKEAKYEADRASIPITLMDMNGLVSALIDNYEGLDAETRTLLPLAKLYWPI